MPSSPVAFNISAITPHGPAAFPPFILLRALQIKAYVIYGMDSTGAASGSRSLIGHSNSTLGIIFNPRLHLLITKG
jgi:hypothetical protein